MMPTYPVNRSTAKNVKTTGARNVQKVVVVNSNPEILTLAERALEAGHYDVVFVESIAHAYSQIRRVQPNLVILCLRLSEQEGFQVLSMLKLDPDTKDIPVLTYAAEDFAEQQEEAEEEDDPSEEFFSFGATARMN
jgi:CheY-like chemotaxis protein